MTKSSQVLRLAAEYAFNGDHYAVTNAFDAFNHRNLSLIEVVKDTGYWDAEYGEESVMCLCLAAAIAESEGD